MRERQRTREFRKLGVRPHRPIIWTQQYNGGAVATCDCGTCRKCVHRVAMASSRSRHALLNVPYERCPIFARLAHDAAVHALYELELDDCGLKKVRRDASFIGLLSHGTMLGRGTWDDGVV